MQFYDHLHRPDLVEEVLKGDPEGKYKDAARRLNLETILDSGPAPRIELLPDRTEKSGETDQARRAARRRGRRHRAQGDLARQRQDAGGDTTAPGLGRPPRSADYVVMEQTLTVDPSKKNEVEIIAYNGKGLLATQPLRFSVDAWGVAEKERPRLFVLAVGVDKYAKPDWQLRYAAKDASAFAEALKRGSAGRGSRCSPTCRSRRSLDAEVTERNIAAEFERLAGIVKAQGRVRAVPRRARPVDRRRGLVLHPAGLRPRQGPPHREERHRARQAARLAGEDPGGEEPRRPRCLRVGSLRGVPRRRPRARDGDGAARVRHRAQLHHRGPGGQGRLRRLQGPRRADLCHPGGPAPARRVPLRTMPGLRPRTSPRHVSREVPTISQRDVRHPPAAAPHARPATTSRSASAQRC